MGQEEEPSGRPWRSRIWQWTGIGEKTLWDWLQLLGALAIPLVVFLVGTLFTAQQSRTQREIEEQRAQGAELQAYLDQMHGLLVAEHLRDSEEGSEVRTLARARTLTVLGGLDSDRKGSLLRFLYEAKLIDKEKPILDLTGVDAADADLRGAILGGAAL